MRDGLGADRRCFDDVGHVKEVKKDNGAKHLSDAEYSAVLEIEGGEERLVEEGESNRNASVEAGGSDRTQHTRVTCVAVFAHRHHCQQVRSKQNRTRQSTNATPQRRTETDLSPTQRILLCCVTDLWSGATASTVSKCAELGQKVRHALRPQQYQQLFSLVGVPRGRYFAPKSPLS